ncbi:MAG: glycosyltransferase [Aquificaceae bacterium]|nr:glycosyltransferase [Aquificaceae bacterium]MDW8097383.1 glycosyltransferase [Aquificaceae bacterium]
MPTVGPQKFHERPTSRLGGVGVVMGLVSVLVATILIKWPYAEELFLLFLVSLPAFLAGLLEDLTKSLGWKLRAFLTLLSAGLSITLLDIVVVRVDLPYVDALFQWWPFSAVFTAIALLGITNSINIIDGFNGLASMVSALMFLGFGYVAYKVDDSFVALLCLVMVGALLGFFLLNYPKGLIFLGDGGAYLTGFLLGVVGILLVKRNPEVSAWLPVVVCIYPIFEVLFSMYRKAVLRKMSPFLPDGLHLHMLFYKRLTKLLLGVKASKLRRNASTSPFLWLLCSLGVVPGVLWWNSTPHLMVSAVAFALVYLFLYWKVLMRRPPSWAS